MENNLQQQIDDLNRKMDLILELLSKQEERSEVVEDLVEDVNIVVKDAFQTAVEELTVQNIKVDGEDIRYLVFKLLRNVKTFGELMDMLESLMDFLNDIGPVVHDAGIAATKALDNFDKKGYFDYLKQLGLLAADFKEHVTEEDLARLRESMPAIGQMIRNLAQPKVMNSLAEITQTLSEMEMDEKFDNKSLFGLARQLSKPEVRRTLSFTLRVLGELGKVKN
ncbi:DUF1641 domain-containing protein [Tenuifilum sp.]|uniref:DUF1641 domain-containing protein n=1 Tax=Tenuifilum sp. TaxID=2760880 RepID=UPI002586D68F|nr:DUF1641 domain-containing protein [Tenuifilum sp.]